MRETQKALQQAADVRAYRIVEAVIAAAGGKGKLEPGTLFPSLQDVGLVEGETEEDDAALFQQFSAVLHRGALS